MKKQEIIRLSNQGLDLYLSKSIYGFVFSIKKKTDTGFIKIADINEGTAIHFIEDSKKTIVGTEVMYKIN